MQNEQLTVTSFKEMWKKDLLPSIKKEIRVEIKAEIDVIKQDFKEIVNRCSTIETSQKFISQKFEETLSTLQQAKKHITDLEMRIKDQEQAISQAKIESFRRDCEIDEAQQYSRRDCLEIVGIPRIQHDDPKQLFKELCSNLNVKIEDADISTIHRLPDTKKSTNRIIVKLVRKDKKDEIYKSKKKIVGKSSRILPSVAKELETNQLIVPSKIYLNESLTSYRKKLFGKIYKFKIDNNYKHLWTLNGKIFLKESDSSPICSFTTFDDFNTFEARQP